MQDIILTNVRQAAHTQEHCIRDKGSEDSDHYQQTPVQLLWTQRWLATELDSTRTKHRLLFVLLILYFVLVLSKPLARPPLSSLGALLLSTCCSVSTYMAK